LTAQTWGAFFRPCRGSSDVRLREISAPTPFPWNVSANDWTGSGYEAVLDAYGWSRDRSDEAILERLLALNLEREAA
jgi:hypothetical protein